MEYGQRYVEINLKRQVMRLMDGTQKDQMVSGTVTLIQRKRNIVGQLKVLVKNTTIIYIKMK